MKRLLLLGLIPVALTAAAQTMDHSSMPGMVMPGDPPKTAKKTAKRPPPVADKGNAGPTKPSSKAMGATQMDHSSMPGMAMPGMTMPAPKSRSQDHSSMPGMNMPAAKAPSQDHSSMPGMAMPGMTMPAPKSRSQDHSSMPGMSMPAAKAPSQDHSSMPGMNMPGMTMPASQSGSQDHSPMPGMNMPGHDLASMSQVEIPHGPPPPPPGDHAADHFFSPISMMDARAKLQSEHGGAVTSKVMVNLAEYQVRNGADGYRWDGQAWYGGDLNRFVLTSEGEGTRGEGVETAELQALYSRAVGVYTDAQFGLRQDFEPHSRTYVTAGFQSLLPYWFDVTGALFLSTKGELLGRFEGTYDFLLTNTLILQPRAELNFAAQDTAVTRTGSGLSNAELGLRLRYEITREFAPYIGLSWDRQFGQTANYSRAAGKGVEAKSIVIGIRTFF
jgi:copper resistance protein B